MRSFTIYTYRKSTFAKENKNAKRDVRIRVTRCQETELKPRVWLQQETTTNEVEDSRNIHMQSDSASKHQRGPLAATLDEVYPKNYSIKALRPELHQTNAKATGSSDLESMMFSERMIQNIYSCTNFTQVSARTFTM